jgi:hypothetical protein
VGWVLLRIAARTQLEVLKTKVRVTTYLGLAYLGPPRHASFHRPVLRRFGGLS